MPVIDGVKMACAACIRGHRSTSCQHTDRPLLEVRKKGRPMTQCNHCRELRKVKQVHVRCACKPDESEAPKRVVKGKDKRAEADQPDAGCSCDETGVCTCAVPRSAAPRAGNRLSVPSISSIPTVDQPHQDQSCCSRGDDSTARCGSSSDSTSSPHTLHTPNCCTSSNENLSPSTSCCTNPPTPPDPVGFHPGIELTGLSSYPPLGVQQSESQPSEYLDSFWPDLGMVQNSKSRRYTPYPQSTQPTSTTSTSGPSKLPVYRQILIKDAIIPPSTGPFDAETALWDSFLREPLPPNPVIPPPSIQPAPVPPPNCSCVPCPRHAADLSSLSACSETGVCDTCFDCTALQAALSAIDLPSQPTSGGNQETLIPTTGPIAPNTGGLNPPLLYDPPSSNLAYPLGINPAFVPAPAPLQLQDTIVQTTPDPLPSSTLAPGAVCTCQANCRCFMCAGSKAVEPEAGGEDSTICTTCKECEAFTKALDELQKHFTDSTPAAVISDLGLV